jgi:hypothetical protein
MHQTDKLMVRLNNLTLALGVCVWCSSADAGYIYATSVVSSGTPVIDEINFPASLALGPPDVILGVTGGIQFGEGSILTFDLGSLQSVSGILSIFTFDTPYPASARIEISADGTSFALLAARIWDDTGTTAPPFYPSVDLVVTTPFRYVRITDFEDPEASFDLDAVGFLAGDVQPVPEPASVMLFGMGILGLPMRNRRRTHVR